MSFLSFQNAERYLKQIRLQNIKDSKIPKQIYKTTIQTFLSFACMLER